MELASFQPKLSDAQLVIAKENGLPSWAKLKGHIQRLDRACWMWNEQQGQSVLSMRSQ